MGARATGRAKGRIAARRGTFPSFATAKMGLRLGGAGEIGRVEELAWGTTLGAANERIDATEKDRLGTAGAGAGEVPDVGSGDDACLSDTLATRDRLNGTEGTLTLASLLASEIRKFANFPRRSARPSFLTDFASKAAPVKYGCLGGRGVSVTSRAGTLIAGADSMGRFIKLLLYIWLVGGAGAAIFTTGIILRAAMRFSVVGITAVENTRVVGAFGSRPRLAAEIRKFAILLRSSTSANEFSPVARPCIPTGTLGR